MRTEGGAPCTVSNTRSSSGCHCSTFGGGLASSGLTAFASGDGAPLVDVAEMAQIAIDRLGAPGARSAAAIEAVLVEHLAMIQAVEAALISEGCTLDIPTSGAPQEERR